MKSSKGLLLALFVLLAALLLLSTTRLGVFLIFDLVGGSTDNLDVEPDNSPLLLSRKLSAESTYDLPTVVEQASGIVFSEDTIYVSTDQGELFTFNLSFDLKDQKANLLSGLLILKQGRLEAITVAERRVLGIGEIGAIGVWEKGDGVWRRQQNIALPLSLADEEFTGICINSKGIWATVSETSNLINLGDGSYSTIDFRQLTKLDADLSALMISGIDCDDDYFYLITENYTSIIILDETYTAVEVIGIDAGEASDIAVHDRYAYVTVDHNYFNELVDWTPTTPICVFSGEADIDVSPKQADILLSMNPELVTSVSVGNLTHDDSVVAAAPMIRAWFDGNDYSGCPDLVKKVE